MIEVVVHVLACPAGVPLNVTVLVPCGDPNPLPVIVTVAPTAPEVGERLVMLGTAIAIVVVKSNSAAIANRRALCILFLHREALTTIASRVREVLRLVVAPHCHTAATKPAPDTPPECDYNSRSRMLCNFGLEEYTPEWFMMTARLRKIP